MEIRRSKTRIFVFRLIFSIFLGGGISNVVESSLGLPKPEELAADEKKKEFVKDKEVFLNSFKLNFGLLVIKNI